MNRVLVAVVSLLSICLGTVASLKYDGVLNEFKKSFEAASTKLTDEQKADLNQFKVTLSHAKNIHLDNPFQTIQDEVWTKAITSFLEKRVGGYPADLGEESQEKFFNDYNKHLKEPCETLRSSFKVSLVAYYSRHNDKEFIELIKKDTDTYNLLLTADVCQYLVKMTESINTKSFNYLAKQKKKGKTLIGKVKSNCLLCLHKGKSDRN